MQSTFKGKEKGVTIHPVRSHRVIGGRSGSGATSLAVSLWPGSQRNGFDKEIEPYSKCENNIIMQHLSLQNNQKHSKKFQE